MIAELIEKDLKAAMLGGDKPKVQTLRTLKGALQNEAISLGVKDSGLNDEQLLKVLAKEAKKRQEAADLYFSANENQRAQLELAEKAIIEAYLPEQLSEAQINSLINDELSKLEEPSPADMGRIIGAVISRAGAQADGAQIAKLVKQALDR